VAETTTRTPTTKSATKTPTAAAGGDEVGASSPGKPLVELRACDVDLTAVEHGEESLLEQVRAVDASVVALKHRELVALDSTKVPGVLLQCPSRALELGPILGGGLADLVAPDLIDCLVCEPLDVKSIEDDLRIGASLGDCLDVRSGHVDRDRLELGAARRSEHPEEGFEGVGALSLARPEASPHFR
jgi:hypothetical protein